MPATKKTDNDYLGDKIQLRIDHTPSFDDRPTLVLDCFGGNGLVWRGGGTEVRNENKKDVY